MIGWAGRWTQTPSATPLQPKQWNAHFCITFNIWCWPDWSMDLNLIHHSSPAKKMKCSFLGYVHLLMISQADRWTQTPSITPLIFVLHSTSDVGHTSQWTQTPSTTPLQPKKMKCFFYGLHSTSDDWPGWSMDSNPIHHPSAAKKNEMLVFGLRSFLMICLADWWTWTSSATPLLPKKWNAQFSIMFNFWWSAKLVNWLKVHLPALSSQ